MQNDITKETAEAAFLHYLQKLDEVGKLEVMGIFIEQPTAAAGTAADADTDAIPDSDPNRRVLHVVARTYGDPQQWFYRKLTTNREWHEGIGRHGRRSTPT